MAEQILRTGLKEGDILRVDFDSEKQQIIMQTDEAK
jgi:hypothetical protein